MSVSVIVPTYYRPDDLVELLVSLIGQSVKPLEVIVIDDTPIDVVRKVVVDYQIRFGNAGVELYYIRNPRVRSASVARNIGIKEAKGAILLFVDSDIVLYPDYIQKIVEVFKKYDAVGVQGWIVNLKPVTFPLVQAFKRMFFIGSYRRNGYKFYEYPFPLTGIINCEAFRGANMAFRSNIFKGFRFDENLRYYSYNEDLLLSYSVFRQYPKGLFSTPYAKCVHKISKGGRMKSSDVKYHMNQCRRYVLTKLFGVRGIILYHWQNVGILSREIALKLVKDLGAKSLIRMDFEEE